MYYSVLQSLIDHKVFLISLTIAVAFLVFWTTNPPKIAKNPLLSKVGF